VRDSLAQVAKRIAADRVDPDVMAWASKALSDAGFPKGQGARGAVILEAIRAELGWMPDALDAEVMMRAGLLIGKDKKFWGQDCDGLCIACGAALASVGIPVVVVGVGYAERDGQGNISHVLLWAHDGKRWQPVDPSTKHPYGSADKADRERVIEPLSGKVLCDADNCMLDGTRIPADVSYQRPQGDFVGVSGPPIRDELAGFVDGPVPVIPVQQSAPPTLDQAGLEAYAQQYGEQAARQLVIDQTGIDPGQYMSGGQVDWGKVAGAVSTYYAGFDASGFVDSSGNVDWRHAASAAGGAAAAAVCTSFGVGVFAVECSQIGSAIGAALYDVASSWAPEAIGFGPDFEEIKLDVYGYIYSNANWSATVQAWLAARALSVTAYKSAYSLAKIEGDMTGRLDLPSMVSRLDQAGLSAFPGWQSLVGGGVFAEQDHYISGDAVVTQTILKLGYDYMSMVYGGSSSAPAEEFWEATTNRTFAADRSTQLCVDYLHNVVSCSAGGFVAGSVVVTWDSSAESFVYSMNDATRAAFLAALQQAVEGVLGQLKAEYKARHTAISISLASPASSSSGIGPLGWAAVIAAAGGGLYYARRERWI